MQRRILRFVTDRNWKQFHNPKDLSLSLVLEATEVMEHFQWKNAEEMEKHLKDNKQAVADELVDVLYWILLMASYHNIDLLEAFERKMEENDKKYPKKVARGRHDKYTKYKK